MKKHIVCAILPVLFLVSCAEAMTIPVRIRLSLSLQGRSARPNGADAVRIKKPAISTSPVLSTRQMVLYYPPIYPPEKSGPVMFSGDGTETSL